MIFRNPVKSSWPGLDPAIHVLPLSRHCEPTGRANARPMTGSAKQSSSAVESVWIASSLCFSQ